MDLRQLRYVIAVAEEGHISRAAERLGMQQPPLSRQIKAVERELSLQLFRRKARGVELTEAGRALLDGGRATLAGLEQAVEAARRAARGEQGRIAVGYTPSAPFHPLVPSVIRAYREAFPLVSLKLADEGGTGELIEQLREERTDVAFIRMPVVDLEGIVVTSLLEEPMVVALPIAHPLSRSKPGGSSALVLRDLANEIFVAFRRPTGPGLFEATLAACHAAGFNPRVGPEAPHIASTLSLVAAGLGISIVTASMQRLHVDGVAFRQLKGRSRPKAPLMLASRRGDPSQVVRQFVNLVKRVTKNPSWPTA